MLIREDWGQPCLGRKNGIQEGIQPALLQGVQLQQRRAKLALGLLRRKFRSWVPAQATQLSQLPVADLKAWLQHVH
ncbi:hypothetical protein L1047_16250 [Synechococcus sp. Nb3U1]|uniref:hypothetical protein n=1 Tax=Synechococcus sp. Nb3U1 TaxID=1914529 RepID=UPI001F348F93|nr:hypothetical protein [Synechococcus sp. Nb3U1]MCF2972747.1 hypothetical protein [Synechococcus sp. Nb3U1]